ncbi:MAG: hypothetical protein JNN15_05410 [Blastocatellia bacterium]|nr:hypothetical protein [Blastocatellia bacterium]
MQYLFRFIVLLLVSSSVVYAQQNRSEKETSRDPSRSFEEFVFRSRIERDEAKVRKMGETATELDATVKHLNKTAIGQNSLSSDHLKTLEKIEKLAKKIRSEQGGDDPDDDKLPTVSQNWKEALERLEQLSDEIMKETAKVTRLSISASLIEQTNEVVAITKSLRKSHK